MLIDARRRRHLAATAGALAPLLAFMPASASDVTVTNARTTPVTTSNVDGTGPGNVTVNSGGSIAIGDPVPVTLDSSNVVSNAGAISTTTELGATGINALTTLNGAANNLTGSITNSGTISVPGPASDSANLTTNAFNSGIRLQGLGSFTGAVTNSGTISVGGQSSYGIWVNAPMVGDLTNSGTITTTGTGGTGIFTTAPITGNIYNSATLSGSGTNSIGMYIGSRVTGTIIQSGTISVGQAQTYDTVNVDANGIAPLLPQVPATAGIWLAGNVDQGLLLAGNGYTKAQEAADTSISTTGDSTITAIGSAPGVLVAPGGAGGFQNIVIGQRPDTPFALVNNGNIITSSTTEGVNAVGVDVRGATNNGVSFTATLSGGFFNAGGNVNVAARDATATGVHVGAGGVVPELRNSGDILVNTIDSTANNSLGIVGTKGGTAYGVVVDAGGTLNTFTNTGNLTVTSQGPNSSFGVVDKSGTLSTFFNSGKITPIIDRLSPGSITAVDLRANTTGVTFTNNGTITGPVYLGSGTNVYSMNTANQYGNLSFVGGTNSLSVTTSTIQGNVDLGASNSTVSLVNSTLNGGLSYSTGSLSLTAAQNSHINIPRAQTLKVTNASFDATSTVSLSVTNAAATNGLLVGTGNVSFANGAKITPVFESIITTPQTVTLVSSGNLSVGGPLSSLVVANVSYINTYTSQLDASNPNNITLTVRRKTTGEMGLNANMAATLNGAVNALNKDADVAAAISAPGTREGFLAAFRQLTPDNTDVTRQIAVGAQDMSMGAVKRRLSGIADTRPGASGDRSSIWLEAMGNGLSAGASGDDLGYSAWGVGIALGADTALTPKTKVGVNFTEMFHSVNFGVSPNSDLFVYGSQMNFYARQEVGPIYVQGMVGAGLNKYEGTRNIRIATLKRTANGEGTGYQVGGTVEVGTTIGMGAYKVEPYLRAQYLKLYQGTYTEQNGGDGVDLTVDSHSQQSLRGGGGVTVGRQFALGYDSNLAAEARGNYSHEFMNGADSFTARFSSDSTQFTNSILMHGPNYYSAGFSVGHKDSFSSITLDYDGEATGKFTAHTASVSLRFRL